MLERFDATLGQEGWKQGRGYCLKVGEDDSKAFVTVDGNTMLAITTDKAALQAVAKALPGAFTVVEEAIIYHPQKKAFFFTADCVDGDAFSRPMLSGELSIGSRKPDPRAEIRMATLDRSHLVWRTIFFRRERSSKNTSTKGCFIVDPKPQK